MIQDLLTLCRRKILDHGIIMFDVLITMGSHIATELKPRLSPGAAVTLPSDEEFRRLVSRWREWHAPSVAAVVQVATEGDIQEAVSKYMCLGIARHCLVGYV